VKLTGPAAAETIGRERVKELPGRKDLAACGWVRVERKVRWRDLADRTFTKIIDFCGVLERIERNYGIFVATYP